MAPDVSMLYNRVLQGDLDEQAVWRGSDCLTIPDSLEQRIVVFKTDRESSCSGRPKTAEMSRMMPSGLLQVPLRITSIHVVVDHHFYETFEGDFWFPAKFVLSFGWIA